MKARKAIEIIKAKHDLRNAVKEALDTLPSAVCYFTPAGTIKLCNTAMYELYRKITQSDLQSLTELNEALEGCDNTTGVIRDGNVFFFPDGHAWQYSAEKITTAQGEVYTEVIFDDVTELYEKQQELKRQSRELKKMYRELKVLSENVLEMTREQEILKITSTEHFGIWNSGTSDMIITSSDPNATLEINVENSDTVEGIKGGSSSGSVTLKGYADVTVKAKTTGNYKYFFGIVAYDNVSIIENASFTAICNGAGQAGYGIFSTGGGITLDTYGDVYIDVFQVGTYGIGIYEDSGNNNIKRVDSLTVRYKGNDGSFYPPSLFDSVKDNYVINIKETGNEGIATYRYGTAHKVTVTNGTCDVTGTSTGQFLAGDTVKVTANDAPEGYQLKGWTSDDVSVPYISVLTTSFTMPDKDVTVSAEYALRPLTVTFDTNGHGTAPSNQIVNYGEKANKPKDLTAEGYTFGGWYKDADCTMPFDFKNTPITEDITLYANWLSGIIHTVTFANGNTASAITTELPEAQLVADGKLAAKPEPDPTAEGWIFGGWHKSPNGGSLFDFATETITGDITLYADWAHPYYVYFDANGGTGTMEPVAVYPGYDCTIPECGFTAPEGKQFKGWAFDANSTEVVQFTSFEVTGGDKTLYAIWSDVHNHSWATEYSKDENYHWVDCTAPGCDITANSYKLGYSCCYLGTAAGCTYHLHRILCG